MTEKSEASEEIPAARQQGGLDLLRTSRALPPAVLTYHDAACKLISWPPPPPPPPPPAADVRGEQSLACYHRADASLVAKLNCEINKSAAAHTPCGPGITDKDGTLHALAHWQEAPPAQLAEEALVPFTPARGGAARRRRNGGLLIALLCLLMALQLLPHVSPSARVLPAVLLWLGTTLMAAYSIIAAAPLLPVREHLPSPRSRPALEPRVSGGQQQQQLLL